MLDKRVLILFAFVVGLCLCQEEFHCKPKLGCEIARCEPSRFSSPDYDLTTQLDKKQFPITCTSKKKAFNKEFGNEEMKAIKSELNEKIGTQQSEMEELKEDLEILRKLVIISQTEIYGLQQKNDEMENETNVLKTKIETIKQENVAFRQKNEKQENEIKELTTDITAMRKKVAAAQKMGKTQNKKMEALNESNTILKKENADMKKEINDLRSASKNQNEQTTKGISVSTTLKPLVQTPPTTEANQDSTTVSPMQVDSAGKGCSSDEFRYKNRCYWMEIHSKSDVHFAKALSICQERGQTPAYPVDKTHYGIMENQIRQNIRSGWTNVLIWLGFYQDPSSGDVTLYNGEPSMYASWAENEPDRKSSNTNV